MKRMVLSVPTMVFALIATTMVVSRSVAEVGSDTVWLWGFRIGQPYSEVEDQLKTFDSARDVNGSKVFSRDGSFPCEETEYPYTLQIVCSDSAVSSISLSFSIPKANDRGAALMQRLRSVFSENGLELSQTSSSPPTWEATDGDVAAHLELTDGTVLAWVSAIDAEVEPPMTIEESPARTVAEATTEGTEAPETAVAVPAELFAKCKDSVVILTVFDEDGEATATGTGFLVTANGVIATASHVATDADRIEVRFASGDVVDASGVVLNDQEHDVALIKVPGAYYKPLPLAFRIPAIGEEVYTIGNSLDQGLTFSKGMVSGEYDSEKAQIRHNAAISPGNSGGPLIDTEGKVLGVADYVLTGGQLVNFAASVMVLRDTDLHTPKALSFREYREAARRKKDVEETIVFINPFSTRSSGWELLPGVLTSYDAAYENTMATAAKAIADDILLLHPDWKVVDFRKGLAVVGGAQGLYYSENLWDAVREELGADYIVAGEFGLTYELESHTVNLFYWKVTMDVYCDDEIYIYGWDDAGNEYVRWHSLDDHAKIYWLKWECPKRYYHRSTAEQYVINYANYNYADIVDRWVSQQTQLWLRAVRLLGE